jgi:hypothetical protein
MFFFVIGTDHRFQHSEAGLRALLINIAEMQFFEPLTAIAEEYHEDIGSPTVAQSVAEGRVPWFNIDMTTEEKQVRGILEEQEKRRRENPFCRVPSDDVREDAWVAKFDALSGTAIVVCGYLHLEGFVQKLRANGHAVDKRVYLETVPPTS